MLRESTLLLGPIFQPKVELIQSYYILRIVQHICRILEKSPYTAVPYVKQSSTFREGCIFKMFNYNNSKKPCLPMCPATYKYIEVNVVHCIHMLDDNKY